MADEDSGHGGSRATPSAAVSASGYAGDRSNTSVANAAPPAQAGGGGANVAAAAAAVMGPTSAVSTRSASTRHRRNSGRIQQQQQQQHPQPSPSPRREKPALHSPGHAPVHPRQLPAPHNPANFAPPSSAAPGLLSGTGSSRRTTAASKRAAAAANNSSQSPSAQAGPSHQQQRRGRQQQLLSPSNAETDSDSFEPDHKELVAVAKLNMMLHTLPAPACNYKVRRSIGMGTFSTVYLAEASNRDGGEGGQKGEKEKRPNASEHSYFADPSSVALKHLIPTSSPDRILMEVECLRMACGRENVIPLLFCHRQVGDIVLGMPFVKTAKFSDVLPTLTLRQCLVYIKNLLRALAYIHGLNIIHRDVKPANFLFDFRANIFRLVDFGLAQTTPGGDLKPPSPPAPSCKRELTSVDLGCSGDGGGASGGCSPPKKRSRGSAATGASRGFGSPPPSKSPRTPTRSVSVSAASNDQHHSAVKQDHYGSRGSVRRTPVKSLRQVFAKRGADSQQPQQREDHSKKTTPRKTRALEEVANKEQQPPVRRSPRKHALSRKSSGFSKLTISGSAIVAGSPAAAAAAAAASAKTPQSMKRTPSFTILDPTSGVPSDYTPKLQASLTSRHSLGINNPAAGALRFNTPTIVDFALRCDCIGTPKVCGKCLGRRSQKAARAGTPGFRPPEVLLKSEHQTTAVDVWAAGVILLCMLSRTYPFFRAPDDTTALAEIMCLFGTDAVKEAACQYGKRLVCSEYRPPVSMKNMCR